MMTSILDKFINQSLEKLKESGVLVVVHEDAKALLLKDVKSQGSHSREIQTTVRRKLDVPLAKLIIDKRPKNIIVKTRENSIEFI